jgi:serine protease Do
LPARRESGHPFGFAVNELSTAERQRLDLDHGVRVRSVDDGPARDAGLLPDDVILEVEGRRAASVNDFDRLLAHAPKGRPLLLRIRRGAASLFLALRVEG